MAVQITEFEVLLIVKSKMLPDPIQDDWQQTKNVLETVFMGHSVI